MADKDKNAAAQAPTPSVDVEQQPQDTRENPSVNDHSSLVSALKEAFTKDR